MKSSILLLAVLTAGCFAGVELAYHDGTPVWISYGMLQGTWFDVEDFVPGSADFLIDHVDLWFYHHAEHPWDTSDVYIEIWTCDESGPIAQLDQTMVTALHNMPTIVNYNPPLEVGLDFCCIANCEMSAGGWPSLTVDGTPGEHNLWGSEEDRGDYLISVTGNTTEEALESLSWGSLKTVF